MSEQALSSTQAEDNVFELVDVIDPAEIYELTPDLRVNASKEDADLLDGLSDELSNYSAPNNDTSDDENNKESLENLSSSLDEEMASPKSQKDELDGLIDELDDELDHGMASQDGEFNFKVQGHHEENSSDKSDILNDLDNLDAQPSDPFAGLDNLDDLDDLGNFAKELGVDEDKNLASDDDDSSLDDLTAAIAKKREEFNSALEDDNSQSSGKLIESLSDFEDFDATIAPETADNTDDFSNNETGDDLDDLLASLDNASQSDSVDLSSQANDTNTANNSDTLDSLDDILDLGSEEIASPQSSTSEALTQEEANQDIDYITYNPDSANTDVPEDISLDDLEKLTQAEQASDIKKTSAQDLLSELDSLFESEVEDLELLEPKEELPTEHQELIEDITSIDDIDLDASQEEKISLGADPVPVFTAQTEEDSQAIEASDIIEDTPNIDDIDFTDSNGGENTLSNPDFDDLDFNAEFAPTQEKIFEQALALSTNPIQESDFLDDLDVDFEAQLDASLGGTTAQSTNSNESEEFEFGQGAIDFDSVDPSTLDLEALDTELFDLQNDFETKIIDDSEDAIDYNAIPDENPNSFEDGHDESFAESFEEEKKEEKKSFGLGSLSDIIGLIQPITKAASDIMQASQATISNQNSVQNPSNENTNTQAQFNLLFSEFRLLSAEINDLKRKQDEGKTSELESLGFPTMLSAEPSYQEIEENITKLRAKLHNLEESITDTRGDFQLLASEVVAQAEGSERITAEDFIDEMTGRFEKHALQIINFENSLSELENANLQMDTLMTQVRTKVEKNTAKIELLASRLDNIERSLENMDSIVASAAARIIREEIIALLAEDMPTETSVATPASLASSMPAMSLDFTDEDLISKSATDEENLTFEESSLEENFDSFTEDFNDEVEQTSSPNLIQEQVADEMDSFSLDTENSEQEEVKSESASANLNTNLTDTMSFEESQLVLDLPQDIIEEMQENSNVENFSADELDPFELAQENSEQVNADSAESADFSEEMQEANISESSESVNINDDLFESLSANQETSVDSTENTDTTLDIDEILNVDNGLDIDNADFTENSVVIDDILNQNAVENAANSDVQATSHPSISDKESLLNGILYNLKDYKE